MIWTISILWMISFLQLMALILHWYCIEKIAFY